MSIPIHEIIAGADLHYDGVVSRAEEGLPIGNGNMGTLLWTSPTALKMQINRNDVLAVGADSEEFHERHTDYGHACARIDLDFSDWGDDVFDTSTQQDLFMNPATAELRSHGLTIQAFSCMDRDVFCFRVQDERSLPQGSHVKLKMLRSPEVRRGLHIAVSRFLIHGEQLLLRQVFEEKDFYCASAVAIQVVGRPGRIRINNETGTDRVTLDARGFEGGANGVLPGMLRDGKLNALRYVGLGGEQETEMRFSMAPAKGEYFLFVASAATFDPAVDVAAEAAQKCADACAAGYASLKQQSEAWWRDYWEKSYVRLWGFPEAKTIETHYTYYRYIMACVSRGTRFAPKFGGLNLSPRGETKHWGVMQWWSNLNLTYNAALPTGCPEIYLPYVMIYLKNQEQYRRAAAEDFHAKGLYMPETESVFGPEELPPRLRDEYASFMLGNGPTYFQQCSAQLQDYAAHKNPLKSRWNFLGKWPDGLDRQYGNVTHFISSMGFFAYHCWLYYEYTKDIDFLRERAYPFMKDVAEFYRTFPNTRMGADGRYHVYGLTDREVCWGGWDSNATISAIRGLYPALIRASELLDLDADMREGWRAFLEALAEIPTNRSEGCPPELATEPEEFWIVAKGTNLRRVIEKTMECPLVFSDLCTVQTKLTNPALFQIAQQTVDFALKNQQMDSESSFFTREMSWWPRALASLGDGSRLIHSIYHQLQCTCAASEHCYYVQNGSKAPYQNRLTAREGINAISAQRLGNAAAGLQAGLLQSAGGAPAAEGVIRIFPAWDAAFNAEFRLWARGGFRVDALHCDGKIQSVQILSTLGGECRIANPWDGSIEIHTPHGVQISDARLLLIPTEKGDALTLRPAP